MLRNKVCKSPLKRDPAFRNQLTFLTVSSSAQASADADLDANAAVAPDTSVSLSVSNSSTDSSDSPELESEAPANGAADSQIIHDAEEPSVLSQGDASDSAMAESADSVSSDESSSGESASDIPDAPVAPDSTSASVSEPMEIDPVDQPAPGRLPLPVSADNAEKEPDEEGRKGGERYRKSSEESEAYEPWESQPTALAEESVGPKPLETQDQRSGKRSSVSSESDGYEPPEPEGTDSANLAYSPTFSPSDPAPVEDAGESLPSHKQPRELKELTDAPQVSPSEPRSDFRVGLLGV